MFITLHQIINSRTYIYIAMFVSLLVLGIGVISKHWLAMIVGIALFGIQLIKLKNKKLEESQNVY